MKLTENNNYPAATMTGDVVDSSEIRAPPGREV